MQNIHHYSYFENFREILENRFRERGSCLKTDNYYFNFHFPAGICHDISILKSSESLFRTTDNNIGP